MRARLLNFLAQYHIKSRHLYALVVIAILVMASMVVILRGRSPQTTALNISGIDKIESSYYFGLGSSIWEDRLTNSTQWNLNYQNTTSVRLTANGTLDLNVTFASEPNSQAVQLSRAVNFTLAENSVLLIALEASVGIHYGIRMAGQDPLGNTFQAWSESDYLQHRQGSGQQENFTVNPVVQAFTVNGIFPTKGSRISSLLFYLEATTSQSGRFSLIVSRLALVNLNEQPLDLSTPTLSNMDGIVLALNAKNAQGYTDSQFFQAYVDYYVNGTSNLVYTVYYMHGLNVLGQGFDYSSGTQTYQIAFVAVGQVRSYPQFLPASNDTLAIVLAPERGAFGSFQLNDFSIRYISQSTLTSSPLVLDPTSLLVYYLMFLFVTPVAVVILVSRLFSRENNQTG